MPDAAVTDALSLQREDISTMDDIQRFVTTHWEKYFKLYPSSCIRTHDASNNLLPRLNNGTLIFGAAHSVSKGEVLFLSKSQCILIDVYSNVLM